jgi:hypothetical protein
METTEIIVAIIGSNALFSFLQYLITRHDMRNRTQSDAEKNQSDMILGLGHDKILYLTDKIIQRGCITMKEKRNLKSLYEPYQRLGGNGDCQVGYEACEKLPIVSDQEAFDKDCERKKKEYGMEG